MHVINCSAHMDSICKFADFSDCFDTIPDYAVVIVDCDSPLVVVMALKTALYRPITLALKRPDVVMLSSFRATAVVNAQGVQYIDTQHRNPIPQVIVFSSGTTGTPKFICHTIDALMHKIIEKPNSVWLCAYQLGSFASTQVILSALKSQATIVYAHALPAIKTAEVLKQYAVTHASGTPSFWRLLVPYMSDCDHIQNITLGGETADTATLQALRQACPHATILHIYASSELGTIFAVRDCQAGFPTIWLNTDKAGCILQVRNGMLWIKSNRAMLAYGNTSIDLDKEGFFCTGDRVEIIDDRVLFLGREDSLINIGGTKVSLEKVETELLNCPHVTDCVVYGIKNPILGYILGAKIISHDEKTVRQYIENTFSGVYQPRIIDFVGEIPYTQAGKKDRNI